MPGGQETGGGSTAARVCQAPRHSLRGETGRHPDPERERDIQMQTDGPKEASLGTERSGNRGDRK